MVSDLNIRRLHRLTSGPEKQAGIASSGMEFLGNMFRGVRRTAPRVGEAAEGVSRGVGTGVRVVGREVGQAEHLVPKNNWLSRGWNWLTGGAKARTPVATGATVMHSGSPGATTAAKVAPDASGVAAQAPVAAAKPRMGVMGGIGTGLHYGAGAYGGYLAGGDIAGSGQGGWAPTDNPGVRIPAAILGGMTVNSKINQLGRKYAPAGMVTRGASGAITGSLAGNVSDSMGWTENASKPMARIGLGLGAMSPFAETNRAYRAALRSVDDPVRAAVKAENVVKYVAENGRGGPANYLLNGINRVSEGMHGATQPLLELTNWPFSLSGIPSTAADWGRAVKGTKEYAGLSPWQRAYGGTASNTGKRLGQIVGIGFGVPATATKFTKDLITNPEGVGEEWANKTTAPQSLDNLSGGMASPSNKDPSIPARVAQGYLRQTVKNNPGAVIKVIADEATKLGVPPEAANDIATRINVVRSISDLSAKVAEDPVNAQNYIELATAQGMTYLKPTTLTDPEIVKQYVDAKKARGLPVQYAKDAAGNVTGVVDDPIAAARLPDGRIDTAKIGPVLQSLQQSHTQEMIAAVAPHAIKAMQSVPGMQEKVFEFVKQFAGTDAGKQMLKTFLNDPNNAEWVQKEGIPIVREAAQSQLLQGISGGVDKVLDPWISMFTDPGSMSMPNKLLLGGVLFGGFSMLMGGGMGMGAGGGMGMGMLFLLLPMLLPYLKQMFSGGGAAAPGGAGAPA